MSEEHEWTMEDALAEALRGLVEYFNRTYSCSCYPLPLAKAEAMLSIYDRTRQDET